MSQTKKQKEWYLKNRESVLLKHKERYRKNPRKILDINKKWNEKNKEKISRYQANWALIKRYNITTEILEDMLKAQNNKCAICGNVFKNRRDTHIDHNHNTKKVRGLLCQKCNQAIGLVNENTVLLKSAISYLEKHL